MRKTFSLAIVWLFMAGCSAEAEVGPAEEVVVVELVNFYDPCSIDEECPLPSDCLGIAVDYGDVIVEDAMCTLECFDDFDCPDGGMCLDAVSGPPLCYRPCFDDLDCAVGWGCIDDGTGFGPVCQPV